MQNIKVTDDLDDFVLRVHGNVFEKRSWKIQNVYTED